MATYNDLIDEVRLQGYLGQVSDALYNFLGDRGHTGALNDRLDEYLEDLGLTGSLSDKLHKWDGTIPSAWLLEDGFNLLLEDNTSNVLLG